MDVVRSSRANERFDDGDGGDDGDDDDGAEDANAPTTRVGARVVVVVWRRRVGARVRSSNARALRVLGAKENLLDLCERGGGDVREAIE